MLSWSRVIKKWPRKKLNFLEIGHDQTGQKSHRPHKSNSILKIIDIEILILKESI